MSLFVDAASVGIWKRSAKWSAFATAVLFVASTEAAQAAQAGGDLSATTTSVPDVVEQAETEPVTGLLTAPDAVTAGIIARFQSQPVEILGLRTESSSTYALPDGTMATGQGSGPVWVQQGGDGTAVDDWAPVDLTLELDADGVVRPRAQILDLALSGGGDSLGSAVSGEPFATLEGADGTALTLTIEGDLPVPELDGPRATYRDVEPGVDFVVEATNTGMQHFFVVNEAPEEGETLSFDVGIEVPGGAVGQTGQDVVVTNAAGDEVANITTPMVWDATRDATIDYPIGEARADDDAPAPVLAPMPQWVVEGKPSTSGDGAEPWAAENLPAGSDARELAESAPQAPVGDVANPNEGLIDDLEVAVQPVGDSAATVTLEVPQSLLDDPALVYPLVIDPDPQVNLAWGFDTYVQKGYSTDYSGRTELNLGTYDSGSHIARSFISFPTSPIAGKQVLGATLELYEYWAWSCQARNWEVWWTGAVGTGTRWTAQPGWIQHISTSSETRGYTTGGCGTGWVHADVTSIMSTAAQNSYSDMTLGLKASNEADNFAWKRFYSANNGSYVPSIWVTYNSVPTVPTGLSVSNSGNASVSGTSTSTTTPRLYANVNDADGNTGRQLAVDFVVADAAGATVYTETVPVAAPGVAVSIQVPAGKLVNGATYKYKATTRDYYSTGPTSPWFSFTVDTTAPRAPQVSSTAFPSTGWTTSTSTTGTITATLTGDATLENFRWGLDKAPDAANTVVAVAGAGAITLPAQEAGSHVLYVQSVDKAGSVSGITEYRFNVGKVGIVAPTDGSRVVSKTRLEIEGDPSFEYVAFEWRRGADGGSGALVPAAMLKTSKGKKWTSSYQRRSSAGAYTAWDAAGTLGTDAGPIQVRAVLATDSSGANAQRGKWISLTVDPSATGAASTDIGPASVNLLTGDSRITVSDAEEFGLGLVRTISSRDQTLGIQYQPNKIPSATAQGAVTAETVATNVAISTSTSRFHSGTTSLRLASSGTSSDSYVSVGGDASGGMHLGLTAGKTYRVSGWVYVETSGNSLPGGGFLRAARMELFTRNGGTYPEPTQNGRATPQPTVVNQWQYVEVTTTLPADSTEAFLRVYNGWTGASAPVIYWDDIAIEEVWSPLGPEWDLATVDSTSGSAYTRISMPYDDVASVETAGGGEIWFTKGLSNKWWPEVGAETLSLTRTSTTEWRLDDIDGSFTTFSRPGSSGDFLPTASMPAVGQNASRYIYSPVPGTTINALSRIISAQEDGVGGWPSNNLACTGATPDRGCEVMDLTYSAMNTSKPSGTAHGTYPGRLQSVSVWSTDPVSGAMASTVVTEYRYDANGRLVEVWDPRVVTAGAQAERAEYAYDSTGRLTSLTPAAELPYTFTYGQAGATKTGGGDFVDASGGRLLTVSRASLVPGTTNTEGPVNTTTLVYGVPLTTALGGPYDLDEDSITQWAQNDGPTDATAVFGPQFPPGVTTATSTAPTPAAYGHADVHYLNASGLEVNSASPVDANAPAVGYIDTFEYDRFGNVIRTLDATNRLIALDTDALGYLPDARASLTEAGLNSRTSTELAQLLDSRTTYSSDGVDLISEMGPVGHMAVGNDASDVRNLRGYTFNVYDEGAPDPVRYHLVTRTASGGVDPDAAASSLVGAFDSVVASMVDPLVTRYGYNPQDGADPLAPSSGWRHGKATTVTPDATGPSPLTSRVWYDSKGRVVRSEKPGSSGTDSLTTIAVYYSAGPNTTYPACGGRPEWAGQACLSGPAGPIPGQVAQGASTTLPTRYVQSYNRWGNPSLVSETVASGGSTVTRTSTTAYDAADRVIAVSVSTSGEAVPSASVGETRTTYDAVSGQATRVATYVNGVETDAIVKQFDVLGRLTKYTDADDGWTQTSYDRWGRPATVTESLGTSRTYTYDAAVDARGFVTSMTDSVAGTISATWGPDGQLVTQNLPGGVTVRQTYDFSRSPVTRVYSRTSDGLQIWADSVVENNRGQWITHTSSSGTRSYEYDRLGRLTNVKDEFDSGGGCATRSYTYDTRSNRLTSGSEEGAAGACSATAAADVTYAYDAADRLVSTSASNGTAWTYDLLGRTTAMPLADGSGVVNQTFYSNDLIRSQTVAGVARYTWGLDPIQRRNVLTTEDLSAGAPAGVVVKTSHYATDSDEPAWIEESTASAEVTRYVSTLEGSMALTTSATGDVELQVIDLHGDVVATLAVPDPAGEAPITGGSIELRAADEFGNAIALPGAAGPVKDRYSWLGGAQRSSEALGDVVLMGVRLYSPVTGRFLSVDPVDGGSASAYDYCSADPVNCTDLAGTWGFKSIMKAVAEVASVASIIPGPIGMVAAGVSAVAYAATGDWANAALMTAGIAASAVGAGAAVVAVKAAKTGIKVGTMVAKAAPKAERAFNAAKTVVSKVKPALNRVTSIVKRSGCNSFEAGTLVLLADGTQIPIEDVAAGDVVMATDPVTGVTSPEPVTDLIRHLEDHAWVSVTVVSDSGSEVLEATAEHPFFVTTAPTAFYPGQVAIAGGWVTAADLAVGDVVRTADGGAAVVAGVTVAPVSDDTVDWAFNLTVADAHTYYVGEQPVLVHNTSCNIPGGGQGLIRLPQRVFSKWQNSKFFGQYSGPWARGGPHGTGGSSGFFNHGGLRTGWGWNGIQATFRTAWGKAGTNHIDWFSAR